jgi:hypothetical protein
VEERTCDRQQNPHSDCKQSNRLKNVHICGQGLLRIVFIVGVIVAAGVPLLMTLLAGPGSRVHWPPYVPPFIAAMGDWFEEEELVFGSVGMVDDGDEEPLEVDLDAGE